MLYCTYDDYQAAGGTLEQDAFAPLCVRASKLIDRMTFGRAEAHAMVCERCAGDLRLAAVQIIQMLSQTEAAKTSTGYAPGVSSISNDGYAVTFADGALAERTAAEARSILAECLGSDPHGLLYRGCF